MPGPPRLIAALIGEMLGTMAYLQGDVLLLGWLTNSTIVGYYTLACMVVVSVVAVGQAFAMTYHEPLRHAGGALSAGPPLRYTLGLAAAGGLVVLLIGVGLLISPAPTQLAVTMMIMSGFAALRIVSSDVPGHPVHPATRSAPAHRRGGAGPAQVRLDRCRLASLGAVGAAISTTITDGVRLLSLPTGCTGRSRSRSRIGVGRRKTNET